MIKSITAINNLGEKIKLELMRPDKTGLLVEKIDGLGPVKATINTSKLAMYDGSIYNSAYIDQRNIVLSLIFLDNDVETIEDIRHKSYKYFPTTEDVQLIVETDKHTLQTKGHVETNEPTIFSSAEGCSISIICDDPYLYAVETNETSFYGVDPLFEFPFENDSTTEPLLEFGSIKVLNEEVITYDGDAKVGMTIRIHAIGNAHNISIHNTTSGEVMRIDTDKMLSLTGSGITAGDTIVIETNKRDRSITLLRDGREINIRNCLGKWTDWLTLSRGDNIILCRAEGEEGTSYLQFHISNKVVYKGV